MRTFIHIGIEERATGRTTRLADQAIQDFFNKGIAFIRDHYTGGRYSSQANRTLTKIVVDRLLYEHGLKATSFEVEEKRDYFIIRNLKYEC